MMSEKDTKQLMQDLDGLAVRIADDPDWWSVAKRAQTAITKLQSRIDELEESNKKTNTILKKISEATLEERESFRKKLETLETAIELKNHSLVRFIWQEIYNSYRDAVSQNTALQSRIDELEAKNEALTNQRDQYKEFWDQSNSQVFQMCEWIDKNITDVERNNMKDTYGLRDRIIAVEGYIKSMTTLRPMEDAEEYRKSGEKILALDKSYDHLVIVRYDKKKSLWVLDGSGGGYSEFVYLQEYQLRGWLPLPEIEGGTEI